MLSVDFSILNVALPRIAAGVGLELTGLPWVTTAFALPAAGFTLVCGRLADMFGRRRMFRSGMALSLLTTTFAEGAERDRVLGLNGALLSGGFTVGSLLGGTLVGGLLLAGFWLIERRSPAPLASPRVLARRSVKWGNYAGLVIFAMEPAFAVDDRAAELQVEAVEVIQHGDEVIVG